MEPIPDENLIRLWALEGLPQDFELLGVRCGYAPLTDLPDSSRRDSDTMRDLLRERFTISVSIQCLLPMEEAELESRRDELRRWFDPLTNRILGHGDTEWCVELVVLPR